MISWEFIQRLNWKICKVHIFSWNWTYWLLKDIPDPTPIQILLLLLVILRKLEEKLKLLLRLLFQSKINQKEFSSQSSFISWRVRKLARYWIWYKFWAKFISEQIFELDLWDSCWFLHFLPQSRWRSVFTLSIRVSIKISIRDTIFTIS